MEIKITYDPKSYAEFMGLDLDYVIQNWTEIEKTIKETCENLL